MNPVIERYEIRNGVQTPIQEPPYFPHYKATPLELLDATIQRNTLKSALQRIVKYTPGSDKQNFQSAIAALDSGKFTDRAIKRMLSPALEKLKSLPMETRSMQLPVMTRGLGSGRTISFIASTDSKDRHNSRILSPGISCERYLNSNPIVLWSHDTGSFFGAADPANVIGKTVALRKFEHKLEADISFLTKDINPRAEMIFAMCKSGALSCLSISFIPQEVRMEMYEGEQIPVISKCELLEISVVSQPSQADAVIQGRD